MSFSTYLKSYTYILRHIICLKTHKKLSSKNYIYIVYKYQNSDMKSSAPIILVTDGYSDFQSQQLPGF